MHALIVDDSRFVRQWMSRALTQLGWHCSEAEHGGVALEQLCDQSTCFDLMLVDANMPVMDGLQCLERLQVSGTRPPGMRVMMVTTEAESSFIERALELGADEFLMKPVSEELLQSKLLLLGLKGGR